MSTQRLPRSTPESQGVPSQAVATFIAGLDRLRSPHHAMLLRHGKVIADTTWAPYERDRPHSLFSISKSFTSMAVGFAISEGLLALDQRVVELLPDDLPAEISPNLAALTVRHLLTMTTGHDPEPMEWGADPASYDWAKSALAAPLVHEPGSFWLYNTPASYLLSAIVQRRTGERMLDYLTPRLLGPLGIANATWEQSPQGIDAGGFGLAITIEDLAVFGQLLLQRGEWHGRQIVPAEWIDEATAFQVQNNHDQPDWAAGYGYQFWRCRHGAYRGDGAFGQFVVVMQEQDAVLVMNSGVMDMQEVLNRLWELLPAFDTEGDAAELPSTLEIAPLGEAIVSAPVEYEYDGPTSSVRIHGTTLELGGSELEVHPGVWTPGTYEGQPAAASGGWVGDTYLAEIRLIETPFAHTVRVGPTGRLRLGTDVGFAGPDQFWEGDPLERD